MKFRMSHTNTKQNMPLCIEISLAGWLESAHTYYFQMWRFCVQIPAESWKFWKIFWRSHRYLRILKRSVAELINVSLNWIVHKKGESYQSITIGYILLICATNLVCRNVSMGLVCYQFCQSNAELRAIPHAQFFPVVPFIQHGSVLFMRFKD